VEPDVKVANTSLLGRAKKLVLMAGIFRNTLEMDNNAWKSRYLKCPYR